MKHTPSNQVAAFSLVEIVLTIGIIAFAFLGVVGLLPAGMTVFRTSMNTSVGSQIVQKILTEAQQTNFAVLTTGQPRQPGVEPPPYFEYIRVRYFDDEGNELPAAQAAKSVYQARAIVQNIPKFPDGSGKNTIEMNDLATVVVQVVANPGQRPLTKDSTTMLWQETPAVPLQSYPILVSDHD